MQISTQEFARDEWLAGRDQAERYVWRCNRTCLTCQVWQREQQARLGRRAAAMPLVPAPLIDEDTS